MNIPSTLFGILFNLMPAFTEPSAQIFLRMTVGWILCPGRRTITAMIPFADPKGIRAHDAYHRFFRAAAWSVQTLFRLWTLLLVKTLCRSGTIGLQTDDSVIKKTGRKVQAAKYCRDAVRSTRKKTVCVWGLQIVPVCLRVMAPWGGEPLSLPINLRVYRKGGPSLVDLAAEMVTQLAEWLPTRDFLLTADGAYASLAGRNLPRTHIVSRMRSDAAIYDLPPKKKPHSRGRPPKKGKRLPTPAAMAKTVRNWRTVQTCERGREKTRLIHTRIVLWYKVNKVVPLLLVISRDPDGKEKDDFFFTTNLSLAPASVVSEYANRWAIEDTFRNIKQFLGVEHPQCWRGEGPGRAVAMGCLLYGLVWLWYMLHGYDSHGLETTPWYPNKAKPSFKDAIACLRMELWRERFSVTSAREADMQEFCETLICAISKAA